MFYDLDSWRQGRSISGSIMDYLSTPYDNLNVTLIHFFSFSENPFNKLFVYMVDMSVETNKDFNNKKQKQLTTEY